MRLVDVETLRGWIGDGRELAILDAREEGEFGASHLFWAVPCPLSRAELRVPALLPCRATRIACVDDGRGLAEKLAAYLEDEGYTNVCVLEGGTKAWAAAGHVLFSGVNVPSKAFGEWVEHHYGTKSLDPAELQALIAGGRDMVVLDSRTAEEFARMTIPTAVSVPGGELAYRIGDLAPDPNTLVVVNCAGRTRSILGAESLRRAGIPNEVFALRNGTMGWELAGLECDRGRADFFSPTVPATVDLALSRAESFAGETGVTVIDADKLAEFEADSTRTLYVLDVRDPKEYRAGHRPGSVNAPGGQLVQATDGWIGIRGARIVLLCDTGVRSRMAAAWLRLMGHSSVHVAEEALGCAASHAAPPANPAIPTPAIPTMDVAELNRRLHEPGLMVVDVARSVEFRHGHIPGAAWGIRTRLAKLAPMLKDGPKSIVVTSPDGVLARLAVAELENLTGAPVHALAGGTDAWRAAGHDLAADRNIPADSECVDFHLRPYDRNTGVEAAMQAYLSWEIDLVHEIVRDGTVRFGVSG